LTRTIGLPSVSVEHNLDAAVATLDLDLPSCERRGHLCSPRQYADEYLKQSEKRSPCFQVQLHQKTAFLISIFISILCVHWNFLCCARLPRSATPSPTHRLPWSRSGCFRQNPVSALCIHALCGALIDFFLRGYSKNTPI
jgi:hypothetical protein